MRKHSKMISLILALAMLVSSLVFTQTQSFAATGLDSLKAAGWFETVYAEWQPVDGATQYNVYVRESGSSDYTKIDDELIRQYPTYVRADAVGLKAGTYDINIEAVTSSGTISKEVTDIKVDAYNRTGFAFSKDSPYNSAGGVGAYKNDGTLKDGAQVLYVTKDTAKTVKASVTINGKVEERQGLQNILSAYEKSGISMILDVRIIGTVTREDLDSIGSSEEGLQVKGNEKNTTPMNVTIEGIGNDAAVSGFGFLIRNGSSVEFRNFGILNFMDDALSFDTNNKSIWVHNMDFTYGQKGSASDQVKGDGTVDIKSGSSFVTVSYNHFWDSGKCSLCGMKGETEDTYVSYHHNWFDHSDSRHARVRTITTYFYNNFYDGNSKYGIASAQDGKGTAGSGGTAASIFADSNYFRNCKYPTLIGMQGSEGGQTLSGEYGAPIKLYNNVMAGNFTYVDYSENNTQFDGYTVADRNTSVPDTVKSVGGFTYNNFDTNGSVDLGVKPADIDEPSQVPSIVMASAGRINGGDFFYTFDDTEDTNDKVIDALRTKIDNYAKSEVTLGKVGGTVDTSVLNPSATPSSALGVDGATKYDERVEINKADGERLEANNPVTPPDNPTNPGGETKPPTEQINKLELLPKDLTNHAGTLTSDLNDIGTNGAFSILANAEHTVTIQSSGQIRPGGAPNTAETGVPTYRAIKVVIPEGVTGATVTVKAGSSGTDKRYIAVSDSTGKRLNTEISGETTISDLPAPDKNSALESHTSNVKLDNGTYYIHSVSGGVYIEDIIIEWKSTGEVNPPEPPVTVENLGDVDGDGTITSNDVARTYKLVSDGKYDPKADVDGEYGVTVKDAQKILEKVLRASVELTASKAPTA